MTNRIVARAITAGFLACVVVTPGCGDSESPPLTAPTPTPTPAPAAALTVTFVVPSTGPAGVATPVRIGGTGFVSGATVTFDGVQAPATVLSSVSISTTAAAHALGTVDVVVTNPGGESRRLADGFAYVAALTSLTISGNPSLTSVGETSQLTATASYSDGTTRDVTDEARWSSSLPAIASVSTTGGLAGLGGGLLTAQALGATTILVRYPVTSPSLFTFMLITVTPIGTFTASGRVREPGVGSIADARVVNVASGHTVTTQTDGYYSLGGLIDGALTVTKAGFEDVNFTATPDQTDDVPMQRVVRIAAGSAPLQGSLAPNDMDYLMADGTHCQPCRLIRITSAAPGLARLRLTWTDPSNLNIWVNGQIFPGAGSVREVVADVLVGADEALVYVGQVGSGPRSSEPSGFHKPFTLSVGTSQLVTDAKRNVR